MQAMACVSHRVTKSSDFPLASDRPKYHSELQYEISQDLLVVRSNALALLLAQITQIEISHWLLLHHKTHHSMETGEHLLTLPQLHIFSACWHQWNCTCSAIYFFFCMKFNQKCSKSRGAPSPDTFVDGPKLWNVKAIIVGMSKLATELIIYV